MALIITYRICIPSLCTVHDLRLCSPGLAPCQWFFLILSSFCSSMAQSLCTRVIGFCLAQVFCCVSTWISAMLCICDHCDSEETLHLFYSWFSLVLCSFQACAVDNYFCSSFSIQPRKILTSTELASLRSLMRKKSAMYWRHNFFCNPAISNDPFPLSLPLCSKWPVILLVQFFLGGARPILTA